jgi:hypothetical protein
MENKMKRYIHVITVMLLLSSAIFAQVTITASDLNARLALGKVYVTNVDNTVKSVNIGAKGNFGTLDFYGLKKSVEYTTTSVALSSTPYASTFSGATIAQKNNQMQSGVAATNYIYLSVGDYYHLHGTVTEATVSGFAMTTKIKFTPAQQFYKLPLTYNATNTHESTQQLESIVLGIPTVLNQPFKQHYIIDGYGKIKTPEGKTVDALRIKSETTITTTGGVSTSTSYNFIAKTGENVGISAKAGQADNGVIQIENITWSDGDGSTNPTAVEKTNEVPTSFTLGQNYPNPFNPSTTISFSIPQQSNVSLKVYNVLGSEVASLVQGNYQAGSYNVDFNASNLASGIYIYTLNTNNFSQSRKMILAK